VGRGNELEEHIQPHQSGLEAGMKEKARLLDSTAISDRSTQTPLELNMAGV
jgi:hypothetical protein